VQARITECLRPIYKDIQQDSFPPRAGWQEIGLTGLAVFWSAGEPHIYECEINSDSYFHKHFHAIGSGGATAYAVYRTLGGSKLTSLDEDKALVALLRIMRTAISVDAMGVSEPITAFSIREGRVRKLTNAEIEANLELVGRWEEKEQERFFEQSL
jgi:hypothetical protein